MVFVGTMKGEHDNDDELDTWQSVGAVTAKLLLRLKPVDFKTVGDEKQIDVEPADDEFVKRHAALP